MKINNVEAQKTVWNTISDLFHKMKTLTKKDEKEDFVLENIGNEQFMFLLEFMLNKRKITGLSNSKIVKTVHVASASIEVNSIEDIVKFVVENNTGSDVVIETVNVYISTICPDPDIFDVMIGVFTKNYPLGMEAKTLNKILGFEFVPNWQISQGKKYEPGALKPNTWFSLTHKLNGNRVTYYRGQLISRQGIPFTGLEHIIKEIQEFWPDNDMVLDGELIRKNTDCIPDSLNFQIGTGVLNSDSEEKSCIEFVVFDELPLDEFDCIEGWTEYKNRIEWLKESDRLFKSYNAKNLRVVENVYCGTDQNEIDRQLEQAEAKDWEGLMINTNVPYKHKRHSGLLKVKKFFTMDLPIVGVEEGANRLAGTLGNLVVDFEGNEVRVGSGFDNETRAQVWANKEAYIGKLVEVKYKEVSTNKKTGSKSLQFPIFVQFRDDKIEPSVF